MLWLFVIFSPEWPTIERQRVIVCTWVHIDIPIPLSPENAILNSSEVNVCKKYTQHE